MLLVAVATIPNFDIFAEELVIPKPELSIGSNHLGSMIKTQTVSNDGLTWIFVTATEPIEREHMSINLRFTDKNGQELVNVNYDILVTQNDQVILDKTMINQKIGIGNHLTNALPSNENVNIKITLQGTGTDIPLTGPHGEPLNFNVVPEFGTIAMMILVVSIVSIVVISAKTRISLKL